jgi:hypothetical protein
MSSSFPKAPLHHHYHCFRITSGVLELGLKQCIVLNNKTMNKKLERIWKEVVET